MNPVDNPFAPGAGTQPPELTGRDGVIDGADIAVQRVLRGYHEKSQILLGLRGTGKTVLLNRFQEIAENHGHLTSFVEAPDDQSLARLLYPKLRQTIRQLSLIEDAKDKAYRAMQALRGFASIFRLDIEGATLSVDPEPGLADSGDLEVDLTDLLLSVGETAKAGGKAWTLLLDEIQYLKTAELSALIVAIHRVNQKGLPILFFGAGLPQIAALTGDAKYYSERLFNFPTIGPLGRVDAISAIREPINDQGYEITDPALDAIFQATEGYPYFLQEWGYQVWNAADHSPIEVEIVNSADVEALRRLDEGFFRVRFERLTPRERDYVIAMARLGTGPYRSADVAEKLGEALTSLGPRRAAIISKGMIYSPAHGDIAFTVPMFDSYLRRAFLV